MSRAGDVRSGRWLQHAFCPDHRTHWRRSTVAAARLHLPVVRELRNPIESGSLRESIRQAFARVERPRRATSPLCEGDPFFGSRSPLPTGAHRERSLPFDELDRRHCRHHASSGVSMRSSRSLRPSLCGSRSVHPADFARFGARQKHFGSSVHPNRVPRHVWCLTSWSSSAPHPILWRHSERWGSMPPVESRRLLGAAGAELNATGVAA